MIVLFLLVLLVLVSSIYFMGDIEGTIPNFKKRFNADYLAMLNCSSCEEFKSIQENMGEGEYGEWVVFNGDKLKGTYNQALMKDVIGRLGCV